MSKPKVTIGMQARLCEWHPNYKAIRKPRNCPDCWKAYEKRQEYIKRVNAS